MPELADAGRRLVVIFGGGITGLAAAHELIERGFRVHVLEPTESLNHYGSCDVGGMARTQYAHLDKSDGPNATKPTLAQVPRVHGTPHLVYFKHGDHWEPGYALDDHIANAWREPTNREKLEQLIGVLKDIRTAQAAADVPKTYLRIVGHTCDSDSPRIARDLAWRRAQVVADELQNLGWPQDVEVSLESRGGTEPIGNNNHESGRARNNRVSFEIDEIRLPGEHGYRFYPAFYWHLDDQLRRIPVYDDKGALTSRSVLDNLEHAESARFAIEDGHPPLRFERRLPRSFEELRRTAHELARRLKFPADDILLFELKMLKFMTSCTQRRKEQYETISWWDFVEGDRYAENTQRHLLAAPQALVAMEAYVTDAYTAGNIYTQLLLDHLSSGTRVDRTMNAPTSEAWLRHWKRYLRMQGVKFFLGSLDVVYADGSKLVPKVTGLLGGKVLDQPMPEPVYKDEAELLAGEDRGLAWDTAAADYYVLALSAQAATKVLHNVPDDALGETLRKLKHYDVGSRDATTGRCTGPLRDFVGIQFYFDHDIKFTSGHSYYPDSDWGLSSISQPQFWKDRRTRDSRYLGVLSVDIGNMVEPDRSEYREEVLNARIAVRRGQAAAHELSDAFTKQRVAIRRALKAAAAACDAATTLVRDLPLSLSPEFCRALENARGYVDSFAEQPRQVTADTLKNRLKTVQQEARTQHDRRVSQVLADVAAHLDGLVETTNIAHTNDAARCTSAALIHIVKAMRFAGQGKTAWQSDPQEIARAVWRQIKLGLDSFSALALPDPLWFHLDDNLEFEVDPNTQKPVKVKDNWSPFQINPLREFDQRPGVGTKMPPEIYDGSGDIDRTKFDFYQVANDQWVVAGMFTKTYTRLATMELAVESARHAVNAILHHIVVPPAGELRGAARAARIGKIVGDFCSIESPERREIEDLAFLKRIDEQLIAEGLPHFLDIIALEDAVLMMKRIRQRGLFADSPLDHALRLLRVAMRTGRSELSALEDFVPMPKLMPSRETVSNVVDKVAAVLHTLFGRGVDAGG
jgi:hypothetical protein